jgi:capsular exopolysaccharide synthesis family protein
MNGTMQPQPGPAGGRVLEQGDFFAPQRREWTLGDLFAIFRRRRGNIIGWVAALGVLAGLYCMVSTPRYRATGQIEVQENSPGTLGLDHNLTGNDADGNRDALDTSMTLETNAQILQSSALALMVVKDLGLETTEDYFPAHKRGLRIREWMFFWKKPLEPLSVPLDEAPNRRFAVLQIFSSHLKVVPVAGTRLIDVSYSSPDPRLAAEVVNRLIGALQEHTFQLRFQATVLASTWLANQLAGLKKRTEDLQLAADRLEQGTGIYGADGTHNLVLARLDGLNGALSEAESNRILKQAVYEVAKSGDPELISGLAGNAPGGATPAMSNSLALLQTLRAQEAQVQAQIDEDRVRYGSAYPKMAELQGQLAAVEKSIQAEITRIGERARSDYEIAQRAENQARDAFEKQKEIATETNDRTVAYELAKQEADGSRDLYQSLSGKLSEAAVLEGLRSTNVAVVNGAMIPPTNSPHSPNVPLCLTVALAGGLFLGCTSALVREATDVSVRSIEELERSLGVPLAGVVPEAGKTRGRGRKRQERSIAGQALESEIDGLPHSFAMPPRAGSSQTVLITSAAPGDGKSRLAASLATSLARSGTRVLLVDADLICPSLDSLFGVAPAAGLANALATGGAVNIHAHAQMPGLFLLWAGNADTAASRTPAGLLGSARMAELLDEWRTQYDFVLLDSAPVLAVRDAANLARLCDRSILLVRYGSTSMQAAQRSYHMIRRIMPRQSTLDVVMNGVPENSPGYSACYGTRKSRYERKTRAHA